MVRTRRTFLKSSAIGASLAIAGCLDSPSEGGIRIPGMYDLGGPISDIGVPYGRGARDVFTYVDEEDVLDVGINHPHEDTQTNPELAQQAWSDFTSGENPPAIVGWSTASTELFAPRLPEEEIVWMSAASGANLHKSEFSYNFFANLDYTSQSRIALEYINQQDPGATVALLRVNDPFGTTIEEGYYNYGEDVGLDMIDDPIGIEFTASNAEAQARRIRDANADWVICQLTASPMQVFLNDLADIYPEADVIGQGWATDQFAISQNPDEYEGSFVVSTYRPFDEMANGDKKGADVVDKAFGNYHDNSFDDKDITNFHYMSGFANAVSLIKGIQNAADSVDDLAEIGGAELRNGIFEIDESESWGATQPLDFQEGDRRATMTGSIYQVSNGEIEERQEIELERRDEWVGV